MTSTRVNRVFPLRVMFVIAALLACATSCREYVEDAALEKELEKLDEMVEKSSDFDRRRQHSIDSTKRLLSRLNPEPSLRRWQMYEELGDESRIFSSDSSVIYYDKALTEARRLGNDSLLTISRIDRINALSAAGIFSAAESDLEAIDTVGMSPEMKVKYALAGRQLYSYLGSYIESHTLIYPEVRNNLEAFTDYLIDNMDSVSPMREILRCERLVNRGGYDEARPKLEALLHKLPQESNLYGRAAFQLAEVYRHSGDQEKYARALALASESDLQGSVKEGIALPILAGWLYDHGNTQRAYNYINLSMKDAKSGNARMRTGMIAGAITVIDDAYKREIEKSRMWVTVFLILAIILLIVAGELLMLSLRRKRKMAEAQSKLSNLTRRQDSYIGHFIALCAYYSDKLGSMSKLVDRKISSGQTDDLMKMIKSGKFTDEHSEDLFTHFDKVFLDLYPDFVGEINKLLRPDCQIELRNPNSMTAEVRIYALVRLGVEESVKISKILRYSTATIYTYRNKMRNRAINRDTFDEDVMKIGSYC